MAKAKNSNLDASPVKRGMAYPKAVDRMIAEFARLPGIGRRSAERLAFYILKSEEPTAMALAQAVIDVKKTVRHCDVCFNLSDGPVCEICSDEQRDRTLVLVVDQPKDLIALEQTSMYRGLYHVLMGRLSPLEPASTIPFRSAPILIGTHTPILFSFFLILNGMEWKNGR